MKQIFLLILLSFIVFYGCNPATTDPVEDKEYTNIIGLVGFEIEMTDDNGNSFQRYVSSRNLSGIKVELMRGVTVVATSFTQDSPPFADGFYTIDSVEIGAEYRLKVSLNEELFQLSNPFTISKYDTKTLDSVALQDYFGEVPKWFETKNYYVTHDYKTKFVFNFIDNDIGFKIYPHPVVDTSHIVWNYPEDFDFELEVLTHLLENPNGNKTSGSANAGLFHFGEIVSTSDRDGIYILKLTIGNKSYYYPSAFLHNHS